MHERADDVVRAILTFDDGTESRTGWYQWNNPQLADQMMKLLEIDKPLFKVNYETLAAA
jgi:hypothetical protein